MPQHVIIESRNRPINSHSPIEHLMGCMNSAANRGGQQEQFVLGLQCEGAPKQCRTLSNNIGFIIPIPV